MNFECFSGSEKYIADEPLIASVNAAVALERPLLVVVSLEPERLSWRTL
jgi:hypothetical protein